MSINVGELMQKQSAEALKLKTVHDNNQNTETIF